MNIIKNIIVMNVMKGIIPVRMVENAYRILNKVKMDILNIAKCMNLMIKITWLAYIVKNKSIL